MRDLLCHHRKPPLRIEKTVSGDQLHLQCCVSYDPKILQQQNMSYSPVPYSPSVESSQVKQRRSQFPPQTARQDMLTAPAQRLLKTRVEIENKAKRQLDEGTTFNDEKQDKHYQEIHHSRETRHPTRQVPKPTRYMQNPNPTPSYASKKDASHHHLNTSKLNRTIVNELIDPDHQEDVMDRIEVQNNIVENINETPNYEQEYVVPAEELDDIRQKHGSDIFHCMAPDFRLQDIFEMRHYRLVRGGSAASVYSLDSLDSNHRTLKLVMELPHSREKVLAALIDPANYHLWNEQVDFGNIKLRIYSENTVIAYQKHRAFDSHFRERDFLYIRHLFQKSGVIYMADKSIEHASFPPFDYMTRGEIKYGIWAFEELSSRSTRVICLLHMSFGGTLGGNKSAESMVKYLQSMARLSTYLSRNGRIATKIRDYFDLSWGIKTQMRTVNLLEDDQVEEEISLDGEQELYLTAFPKAEWHDCTPNQSFTTPQASERHHIVIAPSSSYQNNHQFLHQEVFNQTGQYSQKPNSAIRQAQWKSDYNHIPQPDFPHNNRSAITNPKVQYGITPRQSKTRDYLPNGANYREAIMTQKEQTKQSTMRTFEGETRSPAQNQTLVPKTIINQQFVQTNPRSLPVSVQWPITKRIQIDIQPRVPIQQDNLNLFIQAGKRRAQIKQSKTQKQHHSSGEEDYEISKPEQIHNFKDVPIKFNVDGLVILPQDYLKVRHKLSPVKSEYKLIKKKPGWKDYFLNDLWQCMPTGELRCINDEALKEQRGVLNYVLKKFATNLLTGKNIMSVSLPVTVFSQLSYLESLARGFGFASLFLERAATENSAIERLKLVAAFFIGYNNITITMQKPFNPILGETYQGWFNGCPIYFEQISHHPPACAMLMIGRGYRVFGNFEAKMYLGLNSGRGRNQGEYTIQFSSFPHNSIHSRLMDYEMLGISYGVRLFQFDGKTQIYDDDGHFLELTFNPSKKGMFSFGKQSKPADWVQGSLVKTSPAFIAKFRKDKKRQCPSKKDIFQTLANASGRWSESFSFEGVEYYNLQRDQPCAMEDEPYPLNSNCSYRQDIAYKRKKDIARAQVEKERLEVLQRNDKKLRDKHLRAH